MKRPYYICSSGRLCRRQNTVYFEPFTVGRPDPALNDEELLAGFTENPDSESAPPAGKRRPIPVEDIEAFYCMSELDFNSRFFNFLSQNRIPLHLFNYYGHYSGSFIPRDYLPSGFTLVEQVRAYLDPHHRLMLARELVDAASFNILKNLQYYASPSRQNGAGAEKAPDVEGGELLADAIASVESLRGSIAHTDTTRELMGLEGNIRERYYRCWKGIVGDEFSLEKRVKNTPDNAINALVSFCNSLVYATVLGEIYHTHLNPTVSYLHEPGERRYSLALDLSEIFKPILADRMIFRLLNAGQIRLRHFRKELNFCYLEDAGRKIVLKEFDERLKTTIKHRGLGRNVSYRHLIRLEAYKFVNHLATAEPFKAFRAWW